jgi:hypothetical protein
MEFKRIEFKVREEIEKKLGEHLPQSLKIVLQIMQAEDQTTIENIGKELVHLPKGTPVEEVFKKEIEKGELVSLAKIMANDRLNFSKPARIAAIQAILIEYAKVEWPEFSNNIANLSDEEKAKKIIEKCIEEGEERELDLAFSGVKYLLSNEEKERMLKEITKRYAGVEFRNWLRTSILHGSELSLQKSKEAAKLLPEGKEKEEILKELTKLEENANRKISKLLKTTQ